MEKIWKIIKKLYKKDELKVELDSMRKEIYKLSESERLLETESENFKLYSIFYRKA